ncbi:MAG: hypothetical protein JOZ81_31140, partial [Chloroflexi bacterium]|nr:hypothetical protein [Chloroflexota bacterium]
MIIALGVMVVTSLLVAATFVALQGDTHLTQSDLSAKRAYYAAEAGLNAYLYQLNQNPDSWQTCSTDLQSKTPVPGSSTGAEYSYQPIYNSGYSASNCSSDPISALVDSSTGTLRMEFIGYAGAQPQITRGIVASFRKDTPLDYLWYTVYEALDPGIAPAYKDCGQFYRTGKRPGQCNIWWVTGDVMNGPMYTQDQYLISGSPVFGRNINDRIESTAPGSICSGGSCGSAVIKGLAVPGAATIAPPSDNSQLYVNAGSYGAVVSGTTTVQLSGTQATVTSCPTATTCSGPTVIDLTSKPIIYVSNTTGCTPYSYTPFGATYPANGSGQYYGCAGDVYVSGNYTTPVTIGAANNIIIAGNLTTTTDSLGNLTGPATLGLVANQFVRVMHGVDSSRGPDEGVCNGAA